jgi:hypothetical protein
MSFYRTMVAYSGTYSVLKLWAVYIKWLAD